MFKPIDLPKGHWRALQAVAVLPEPPSADQVAALTSYKRSSAGQYLVALERRGLLRSHRRDEDDTVYSLTGEGADLFDQLAAATAAIERLGQRQRAMARRLLSTTKSTR